MRAWMVVAALALLLSVSAGKAQDIRADVAGGTIEGKAGDGVVAYLGIPYAAPPVGDLRWRAPQPVEPWTGIRMATEPGHDCMQIPFEDNIAPSGTTPDEDCLVLNVWRPAETSGEPLPVMIWIPGGWYVNGGSTTALSDGSALAREGMIVVSINYRLGRFGFFAHPALVAANEGPVGNFGYMDQLAAFAWVQDNIAAFGGDPSKVTLVGESAGGASVIHMLTSPAAKGFFRAAVVMSGGGRHALAERQMTGGTADGPSADMVDLAFAESLGIAGEGEEALAALRALPADSLLGDVTFPLMSQKLLATGESSFPGTPMIDGEIVPSRLEDMVLSGATAAVPLMIGTTARDAPGFFPPREDPFSYFGENAAAASEVFNPGGGLPPEVVFLGISADMTMHEPARFLAREMTAAGNPVWLYRFSYVAEGAEGRDSGATHAGEVAYMFQTVEVVAGEDATDNDRAMARAFGGYIANFVKTGDPNDGDLPEWPRFSAAAFDLMNFSLDDGPVFGPDPRGPRIELVEKAADAATGQSVAGAAAIPGELLGKWQWIATVTPVEEVRPGAPERYTIEFLPEGRLALQADCNHGVGEVAVSEEGRFTVGPIALTKMVCLNGSLGDRFATDVGRATSWFLREDRLYIEMPVDSGTLEFVRIDG